MLTTQGIDTRLLRHFATQVLWDPDGMAVDLLYRWTRGT